MHIELKKITIRELTAGYINEEEAGVKGYHGLLDIRPPYQREFIYDDKKKIAVIATVRKGFPLNVMYWAKREDSSEVPFEVMDGQQRTISICQYLIGDFAYQGLYFSNLTEDEKEQILNYELMVYFCEGKPSEKLEWFKTINISGMELTDQEMRNAVYAGPFVSDAKRYFSKSKCAAYQIGSDLLKGTPIRQDYFETVLKWKVQSESKNQQVISINDYMARHQHDPNAVQLWNYYQAVINWAISLFKTRNRSNVVKGLNWGMLYDRFHNELLDRDVIEKRTIELLNDDEVQKTSGIIPYILTGDERELGLRAFPNGIKRHVYEKQRHYCANPKCPNKDKEFAFEEMEGDHITPWRDGGRTIEENCQMLCRNCNRRKGAK